MRAITKRNRGISFEQVVGELNLYLKGWLGYYGAVSSANTFISLDGWIRRRLRQYVFKQWKKSYNRFRRLKALCPAYFRCPDDSITLDWVRLCWACAKTDSYWRAANNPAIKQGLSNRWFAEQGLYSLADGWNERWREGVPTAGC